LLLALPTLALLAILFPSKLPAEDSTRHTRVDERDIMFARYHLTPGTLQYEQYYALHPEKKPGDDRARRSPGLLSPRAKLYDPIGFPAADASFAVIEALRDQVDGPVVERQLQISPAEATSAIKRLAAHYGAHSVGITELQGYHIYSHIGRGQGDYGAPVELSHRNAIAVTTEMSHSMVRQAPAAPAAMETAKQYLAVGAVALQLAVFIRSIGFPALAHIDGNYRVICPLVARDAGLGEIGRMGLLMTPRLGPRVRIAVVTTDLPLLPDRPTRDPTVVDFCRLCLKCAENCPTRSIPAGDQQLIDGARRWQINAETCFAYWTVVGTDCGRCMAVCPYSHPDNALHGLVRWTIRRSTWARQLALRMDDLFYGRRPKPRTSGDWE
jgi:reductive dehalogenase